MLRKLISTSNPDFVLRELTSDDERAYYALVNANRLHLTKHGDYPEMRYSTAESVKVDLKSREDKAMFAGWFKGELAGRFDLAPKGGNAFVIGYWLGEKFTGQGLATAGCQALIDYGRKNLGLTDVWAGVTKGNDPSAAVLSRLGLEAVKDMGSHIRFHKSF
jgi:RimJ/RimL family protein N-acetyltransferase